MGRNLPWCLSNSFRFCFAVRTHGLTELCFCLTYATGIPSSIWLPFCRSWSRSSIVIRSDTLSERNGTNEAGESITYQIFSVLKVGRSVNFQHCTCWTWPASLWLNVFQLADLLPAFECRPFDTGEIQTSRANRWRIAVRSSLVSDLKRAKYIQATFGISV